MDLSSEGFNPVIFMYLNPELCLTNSIYTVEEARNFREANPSLSFQDNLSSIPEGFSTATFLSEYKDNVDFSRINQAIKNVSGVGIGGVYYPTIFKTAVLLESNIVSFEVPGEGTTFTITSNNINTGDCIKVFKTDSQIPYYVNVTSVISSTQFTIAESNLDYGLLNIYGIKLHDAERLALIEYLNMSTDSFVQVNINSNFNPDLYRLLYPEKLAINNLTSFTEYLASSNTEIGSVYDIGSGTGTGSGTSSTDTFQVLNVNQHLKLNFGQSTGKVTWNNTDLYYVTTNPNANVSSLSSVFQGLITEKAIKQWVNQTLNPSITLDNVIIRSNISFPDSATMYSSNLTIAGSVNFNSNCVFKGVIGVEDSIYSGKYGIFDDIERSNFNPVLYTKCNIHFSNAHFDKSLYIGDKLEVNGDFYGNSAAFKGSLQTHRIGIGSTDFVSLRTIEPFSNSITPISINSNSIAYIPPSSTTSSLQSTSYSELFISNQIGMSLNSVILQNLTYTHSNLQMPVSSSNLIKTSDLILNIGSTFTVSGSNRILTSNAPLLNMVTPLNSYIRLGNGDYLQILSKSSSNMTLDVVFPPNIHSIYVQELKINDYQFMSQELINIEITEQLKAIVHILSSNQTC